MKKMLVALTATVAAGSLLAGTVHAADEGSIAEIAASNGSFNTLVAALDAAGLTGAVDSCDDEKLTVFAPTDAAFAAALEALGMTAEELLADTELLTSVLTYHVVAGEVPASTVVTLTEATTLNGAPIKITVSDSGVVLNDTVNVVTTDIQACNGIIHVIDAVLLPPAPETTPDTTVPESPGAMPETGSSSTLLAVLAAGLVALGAGAVVFGRRRPATVKV